MGDIILKDQYWVIYIPEEGDWKIVSKSETTKEEARKIYLKWAGRKRLPKGALIHLIDN